MMALSVDGWQPNKDVIMMQFQRLVHMVWHKCWCNVERYLHETGLCEV